MTVHTLFEPVFHSRVCHYPVKTVVLRAVAETLALALLGLAIMSNISYAAPTTTTPIQTPSTPQSEIAPTASTSPATPTPTTEPNISVQTTVSPASTVAKCTRGVMPNPSALSLNMQQSGVTRVIDTPSYYTVHGNTLEQVKKQIAACSPVENGRYAAVTVSNINWRVAYYRDPWTNLCKPSNVAVGVHTAFLYPTWSNSTPAWQNFMKNITVHEQGHAERDYMAAQAILRDIQNMPFAECSTIEPTANALANARIAALEQSNNAYDHETSHGATQGAQL